MNYEHSASEISDIKGANEELRYEWHFTKIAGAMHARVRPPAEKLDRNSASVITTAVRSKVPLFARECFKSTARVHEVRTWYCTGPG